jgi:prolyl 4-hydroxylase
VAGPLQAREVWEAAAPALDAAMRSADPHGAHNGPLVVRAAIGADGRVHEAALLVDRVARGDGGDPAAAVEAVLAAVRAARFPAASAASVATLPIMFGGPLPWMAKQKERIVAAPAASPAAVAAPVRPAILAPESPRPEPMFKPFAPVIGRAAAPPPEPPARAAHPRAAIGAAVRERFAANPGVRPIPKPTLEAFVVPDFISPGECEGLIALIEAGCVPSGLMDKEFRTSSTCNLNPAELLVARIESRLNALFAMDPHLGETIQGQRYHVGQQFKPHHDFFHEDQPYWPPQEKHGGQRTWTAMAFLNVPEAGGQTMFPKAGLRVTPATGYLLIWNNMDRDGYPNDFSLHQGCPVEAGTKYVLTKWYRERPWSPVV